MIARKSEPAEPAARNLSVEPIEKPIFAPKSS